MKDFTALLLIFLSSFLSEAQAGQRAARPAKTSTRADSSYVLKIPGKDISLLYSEYRSEGWQRLQLISNNGRVEVAPLFEDGAHSYQASTLADIAPGKDFVLLHRMIYRMVSQGDCAYGVPLRTCVILNLASGCPGFPLPEVDCAGKWSAHQADTWVTQTGKEIKAGFLHDFGSFHQHLKAAHEKRDYSTLKACLASEEQVSRFLSCAPLSAQTLSAYQDIAHFLEQTAAYQQAVSILEKVISVFPHSTAAYLTLGDAYLGQQNEQEAKAAYQAYKDQMIEAGKEADIPTRVYEQLK